MDAIASAWPFLRAVAVALPYGAVVWLLLSQRALRKRIDALTSPDLGKLTDLVEFRAKETRDLLDVLKRTVASDYENLRERVAKLEPYQG
jgi:hypothetical protein